MFKARLNVRKADDTVESLGPLHLLFPARWVLFFLRLVWADKSHASYGEG